MIYVDQRGTGGSGYLDCSKGYPSTEAEWTVCAAEHTGSKLDHYLTVDAAHDLELVRKRLGYAKIHVRGGSYGTRLALELIRQHESSLAAVVLDGVAPPEWDIFGYDVGALDAALKLLADDCGKSAACLAVSPSFAADLEARRLALKASPRKIVVNGTSMLEDDQTFAAFLFAAVDRTATRYRIPRAVHLAVEGDSSVWDTLVSDATGYLVKGAADPPSAGLVGFRPRRPHQRGVSYVAPGLFATVVCAEWLPNSGGVAALQASLAKQTWGDSGMVDLAKACAAWKLSPLAAALRAPVSTKVKTLLLSGEIDIRTPPEMGTLAAKTLSNSQHLVVPYASHSTISVACAAKILTAFFKADGELASLDSSCLKSVPQPAW
jgi:pimeloyl-ACP methyl ester carboxylesterase